MTDVFSVTASWDKASYNAGDMITGTIAGGDVSTTTTGATTQTVGPVTVPIVAANGATATVVFPAVVADFPGTTVATPESVVIDTTRAIVDSGTPARSWVVSANKLSITAVA
jgi:hypothetical protein